jgi:ADP-ribose pyrophosphatase YjhB (NUDIX family)
MERVYAFEDGKSVDRTKLRAPRLPDEPYELAHRHLVIPSLDVFVQYRGGVLLVTRDNYPAKDILFSIGGKHERGYTLEESARTIAKGECGLELRDLCRLGFSEHMWATEPFGHGHGTHHDNHTFFAVGEGTLKLDGLHKDPEIVTPDRYRNDQELIGGLHPFIRDFMALAIPLVK